MSFHKQQPLEVSIPQLKAWFDSELGQELLNAETKAVERMVATLFGVHLVQFSVDARINLHKESPVNYCFSLIPRSDLGINDSNIIASYTEVPIAHESIDVVVLHHTLDFTDSPHQVLREVSRILKPGGHVIIVGFNPFSIWGLYRLFSRKKERAPWSGHFISHHRLSDWLKLLELTELKHVSGYHHAPLERKSFRNRFSWITNWAKRSPAKNGAFSILLARKDIAGMTPLRSGWGLRRLINIPVVKPAAKGSLRETRESR